MKSVMPYILVRNKMNLSSEDGLFNGTQTYIYCQEWSTPWEVIENELKQATRIDVKRNFPPNQITYRVSQPPYVVLDVLEAPGFKVFATSTTGAANETCVWSLCPSGM